VQDQNHPGHRGWGGRGGRRNRKEVQVLIGPHSIPGLKEAGSPAPGNGRTRVRESQALPCTRRGNDARAGIWNRKGGTGPEPICTRSGGSLESESGGQVTGSSGAPHSSSRRAPPSPPRPAHLTDLRRLGPTAGSRHRCAVPARPGRSARTCALAAPGAG
jgi:hypothetical protein